MAASAVRYRRPRRALSVACESGAHIELHVFLHVLARDIGGNLFSSSLSVCPGTGRRGRDALEAFLAVRPEEVTGKTAGDGNETTTAAPRALTLAAGRRIPGICVVALRARRSRHGLAVAWPRSGEAARRGTRDGHLLALEGAILSHASADRRCKHCLAYHLRPTWGTTSWVCPGG